MPSPSTYGFGEQECVGSYNKQRCLPHARHSAGVGNVKMNPRQTAFALREIMVQSDLSAHSCSIVCMEGLKQTKEARPKAWKRDREKPGF